MTARLNAPIMRLAADSKIHIAANLMINGEAGEVGEAGEAGGTGRAGRGGAA